MSSSSLEELDDEAIRNHPWAMKMKQTILDRSNKWIMDWCNVVLQLGENNVDIEQWTNIFQTQIENCYQDLLTDVTAMKSKLINSIEELLKKIQYYTIELGTEPHNSSYEELSLYEVQKELKRQVDHYEEMYTIQKKNLTDVQTKMSNLCKILGETPLYVPTSPLPTTHKIEELQVFLDKLESMKFEREEMYLTLKGEILVMAKELNITASLDFEREVLSETVADFEVSEINMNQLKSYHSDLSKRWNNMQQEIVRLRSKLEGLWTILEESVAEREKFRETYPNYNLTTLKALQNEVKICEDKKKANIQIFVEKLRAELVKLWDRCYCSNEEKQEFKFFFCDCFNEDLLDLHDMELKKWNIYYEENKQLIDLLKEYTILWERMIGLEDTVDCSGLNRYKNRGGLLLREEKERSKLTKMIPKNEERIKILSHQFEAKNARPFLIYNNTVSEFIRNLHDTRELNRKNKLSARKQQRDQEVRTPGKSCLSLFSSTSKLNLLTASGAASTSKRKFATPLTDIKRRKFDGLKESKIFQTVRTEKVVKSKRHSFDRKKRIVKCRRNLNKPDHSKIDVDLIDYSTFQQNLSQMNSKCRSTLHSNDFRGSPERNIVFPELSFTTTPKH